ncbi:TetR/AcrR family transcriptional regulator [Pseudomonas sp. sia0905]|uniref:TetR/AcrR family transcriptional regulator n=1 Tax=Pseudomonas sp. sia0905 TaxID=2854783 RepID=UPI001C440D13|nr:TetR/AcrR family transcriptional regulator [Pseudomonas sp. sia0905]
MSGLRERQKELRRQAISAAAVSLFQRQGFRETTIEQIARDAGVSAPTVFKYFGSKHEIILEMIKESDRRALIDVHKRIPEFDDPVDALCHLEHILVSYALDMLPPALWRELLPLVLVGGDGGLPEAYRQMNRGLQGEIANVVRELQAAGKLRADLDVELAAFLLNDYSHLQLLRLTASDEPDMQAHSATVRASTRLIFEGMRA